MPNIFLDEGQVYSLPTKNGGKAGKLPIFSQPGLAVYGLTMSAGQEFVPHQHTSEKKGEGVHIVVCCSGSGVMKTYEEKDGAITLSREELMSLGDVVIVLENEWHSLGTADGGVFLVTTSDSHHEEHFIIV